MNKQLLLRRVIETIHSGQFHAFTKLLQARPQLVHLHYTNLCTALGFAAENQKDIRFVQSLLDAGSDINYCDQFGRSPLILSLNHFNTAQLLLLSGANPNLPDIDGCTALMHAAMNGHHEIVPLLIKHGADVNANSTSGTALMLAVKNGYIKTVKALLDAPNIAINTLDPEHQRTPLFFADEENNTDLVIMLLLNGADFNIKDKYGKTAFTRNRLDTYWEAMKPYNHIDIALRFGYAPLLLRYKLFNFYTLIIKTNPHYKDAQMRMDELQQVIDKLLLQRLFDNIRMGNFDAFTKSLQANPQLVHLHDTNRCTALGFAAENQEDIRFVQSLLDSGSDINYCDELGRSPLILSLNHFNTTTLLLRSGANPNLPDTKGFTALFIAASTGNFEAVTTLLMPEYSTLDVVKHTLRNGYTVLMHASMNGHFEMVELLIRHGAIDLVNHTLKDGDTALMYASMNGHTKVVKLLIRHGADVNANSTLGTALIRAVNNGHKKAVKVLLDAPNIEINMLDPKHGRNALFFADKKNNIELVIMLLLNGADFDIKNKNGEPTAMRNSFDTYWASMKLYSDTIKKTNSNSLLIYKLFNFYASIVTTNPLYEDAQMRMYELLQVFESIDETHEWRSFYIAASTGNIEIVTKLLAYEYSIIDLINHTSPFFGTALMQASMNGHLEIVQLLIEHGADVNINSNSGTALMLAVKKGHKDAVKALLDAPNIEIDILDPIYKHTALCFAAEIDNIALMKMLLLKGVNLTIKDENEKTAFLLALNNSETYWELMNFYQDEIMPNNPHQLFTMDDLFNFYDSIDTTNLHYSDAQMKMYELLFSFEANDEAQRIELLEKKLCCVINSGQDKSLIDNLYNDLCGLPYSNQLENKVTVNAIQGPEYWINMARTIRNKTTQKNNNKAIKISQAPDGFFANESSSTSTNSATNASVLNPR